MSRMSGNGSVTETSQRDGADINYSGRQFRVT